MDTNKVFGYVADRAKEPSTLAAISAVAAVFGYHVDPGVAQTLLSMAAVGCGMLAAARKG